MAKLENKVEPLILTNPDTGKTLTLEFSRHTAKRCERETGINPSTLRDKITFAPMDTISSLFYHALQMHHADEFESADETDTILFDEMGLPDGFMERLAEIFIQPWVSMEADAKNPKWVMK